jgi:hypothetical protein
MTDVFISYSSRNEAFVRRLREALGAEGKDVWLDKEDIGPAVEWRRDIELRSGRPTGRHRLRRQHRPHLGRRDRAPGR